MDCPSCNIENKDDALLCAECGESWEIKISILCPKCNDENLNGAKVCYKCGFSLDRLLESMGKVKPEKGKFLSWLF